jgi:hypothetical protein
MAFRRFLTLVIGDGKRHYELHWNPPKTWTDSLVLSEDGATLKGKTRGGKPIAANRP